MFATNSSFRIPISLQPNISNLDYLIKHNLQFEKPPILGCKEIGIKKSEFVTKNILLVETIFWKTAVNKTNYFIKYSLFE